LFNFLFPSSFIPHTFTISSSLSLSVTVCCPSP
jgi:hypothetical protein